MPNKYVLNSLVKIDWSKFIPNCNLKPTFWIFHYSFPAKSTNNISTFLIRQKAERAKTRLWDVCETAVMSLITQTMCISVNKIKLEIIIYTNWITMKLKTNNIIGISETKVNNLTYRFYQAPLIFASPVPVQFEH